MESTICLLTEWKLKAGGLFKARRALEKTNNSQLQVDSSSSEDIGLEQDPGRLVTLQILTIFSLMEACSSLGQCVSLIDL